MPHHALSGLAARLAGAAALLLAMLPAHAEIKIGFQAPLTGAAATDGKSARIAAEMAIDDVNGAGGVLEDKLQLITYDDQAKPDQAIFTANKLIGEDGVKLVVNASYSASGRAAAPVFQNAGMVKIAAYGVHPDITTAGDDMFRLVHLGPPQGEATALFIGKTSTKAPKLPGTSVLLPSSGYCAAGSQETDSGGAPPPSIPIPAGPTRSVGSTGPSIRTPSGTCWPWTSTRRRCCRATSPATVSTT